jgi:hypothetical protein
MKKIILLLIGLTVISCSSDDGDVVNSSEPQTFLEKYDGTSWRNNETEIVTLINGTYFYNFVDTDLLGEVYCFQIKEDSQTLEGDEIKFIIIKNDPNEFIIEQRRNEVVKMRNRLSVSGDMMTDKGTFFDIDGSSSDATSVWTRTNALYSDYCN